MFTIIKKPACAISAVLSALVLLCVLFTPAWGEASAEAEASEIISVRGIVRGAAHPEYSKTFSADIENIGVMAFKYSDETEFKNFTYLNELIDETAEIKFRTVGPDRVADVISE